MRAILKKENNIDFTHVGMGFIFMFLGGIMNIIGRDVELNSFIRGGYLLIIYGLIAWIILEILIGDDLEHSHPLAGSK